MSGTGTVLALCAAGAGGAVARFVIDAEVRRRWPTLFPWGTFLINLTGSVLLGLLAGGLASASATYAIIGTGFCGGYTTFSTAMVETIRLAQRRARVVAFVYAVGSLVLCTAAAAAGVALGR